MPMQHSKARAVVRSEVISQRSDCLVMGPNIRETGFTWDFRSSSSCAGAGKPNVGVPEGSGKAGKAADVGAAAESAAAHALRPEPELVDGAKPDAALWGVMLLRKPANPARQTCRCEEGACHYAIALLALHFTRTPPSDRAHGQASHFPACDECIQVTYAEPSSDCSTRSCSDTSHCELSRRGWYATAQGTQA